MTQAPGSLDQLRTIRDPAARAVALKAYIANGEEKLAEARRMRDEAVRLLRQKHTHTEVSEMTGLSVAMVRIITRGVSRGTE